MDTAYFGGDHTPLCINWPVVGRAPDRSVLDYLAPWDMDYGLLGVPLCAAEVLKKSPYSH